ncbi:hypothetical protein GN956_G14952 [Arapaima gigas]
MSHSSTTRERLHTGNLELLAGKIFALQDSTNPHNMLFSVEQRMMRLRALGWAAWGGCLHNLCCECNTQGHSNDALRQHNIIPSKEHLQVAAFLHMFTQSPARTHGQQDPIERNLKWIQIL